MAENLTNAVESYNSVSRKRAGFPDKKYNIIYADPPWQYRDKCNAGKRGASHKYPVMGIEEIKALPIYAIADTDCALFMWATFPMIQEALDIIKAWGFEYKTIAFNWTKLNVKRGTPFFGMGNWTRSNAEICLLATRGKPRRVNASVSSVVMSPIREHSRKPDEARDRIVTLLGDLPRIELFARQAADGWDGWGNEYDGGGK